MHAWTLLSSAGEESRHAPPHPANPYPPLPRHLKIEEPEEEDHENSKCSAARGTDDVFKADINNRYIHFMFF